MISFGRPRAALPVNNTGLNFSAQRKVAEAAGRVAEKISTAISVDASLARVWVRNQRGSIQCPCSTGSIGERSTPIDPVENGKIVLNSGQGADLDAVSSGQPLEGPPESANKRLPKGEPDYSQSSDWVDTIGKLLLGDGRRCGLCWGTGWLDGHRLWGGQRFVCCAVDTPWALLDEDSSCDVDLDSPTPTFVGPGKITWNLSTLSNLNILDAFRIRDGLNPADSTGWTLTVFNLNNPTGIDVASFLNDGKIGYTLNAGDIPTKLVLNLNTDARVSHVEIVRRSEALVNVQMPNLVYTASFELVQPFMQIDFEVDPKISWLERGSIFELPGSNGRFGSVWLVQDVNEASLGNGFTWQITGTIRNVQPNEVFSCVSMEDSLTGGLLDYGTGSRGLESTSAGEPSGLGYSSDESLAAVKRGSTERAGGGTSSAFSGVISLTPRREGD